MVSVDDIMAHIEEGLRRDGVSEELIYGIRFQLHLAITTDVEATELDYLERYGRAYTFYFRLADYEHGKLLAAQMYWIFLGERPNMDLHTGDRFSPTDRLYLFVHALPVPQAPAGNDEKKASDGTADQAAVKKEH